MTADGYLERLRNRERDIKSFWNWFVDKEEAFFRAVQTGDVEEGFFSHLAPALSDVHPGLFFLTGMFGQQAELVITPDGSIKNIVFAEECIAHAPRLNNWIFTALKPPTSVEHATIQIEDFAFTKDNLQFYAQDHAEYPDEIDLYVVYQHYQPDADELITNGVYIFLDNLLGELQSITLIDNVTLVGSEAAAGQELIPIEKLQDFLIWRKKEFVENYESFALQSEAEGFSAYIGQIKEGIPINAFMNTDLLEWENKASMPYLMRISMEYTPLADGVPNEESHQEMDQLQEVLMEQLKDEDQYRYIRQQTGDGVREVFFVCKEFRTCSKLVYHTLAAYTGKLYNSYEIYKDKYWQSFEPYRKHHNL